MRTALWSALAGLALGCGSPRRGEPLRGPLTATESAQERGRLVFAVNCYKCHPGGEAGLGPSLNEKRRPDFIRRLQIRHGVGRMPSFDETRLSDKELSDLLSYLALLRRHDGGGQGR